MNDPRVLTLVGPAHAAVPIVLDSPHSGHRFPADFDAAVSEFDLRDGEDCFVDELYAPAGDLGIPLLAAQLPRTYLDANRHCGDIDLELLEGGHWPHEWVPSGKAAIGKALLWRTLDDGRVIDRRKLTVAEVRRRIAAFHAPYHRALQQLLALAGRADAPARRVGRLGEIFGAGSERPGHQNPNVTPAEKALMLPDSSSPFLLYLLLLKSQTTSIDVVLVSL